MPGNLCREIVIKMKFKNIILLYIGFSILGSCKENKLDETTRVEGYNELIGLNQISRLNWFKSMNSIQTGLHRGTIDRSTADRIFYRALSYDMSLTYENEKFDSTVAVKHLKLMDSRGLLNDDFKNDPFKLIEYFKKNPNRYPIGLNLGEKIVADGKAYKKFVDWFNVELKGG